ncbi:helix-turn-helix transcriptional regulator [Caulobacter sp. 1776]|uniref:helix-turn-helix domain-containing protein n=1 Tax=Caulobacter sp. 1776 TaxID=3156420 RepID=UPI003390D1EC
MSIQSETPPAGRRIHPVDAHVGARIRVLRKLKGVSQEQLADALSLTFQQVQKYENGTNRISASKMWQVATFLKVTPNYFFEDLAALQDLRDAQQGPNPLVQLTHVHGGLEIARAYVSATPRQRVAVLNILLAIADSNAIEVAAAA